MISLPSFFLSILHLLLSLLYKEKAWGWVLHVLTTALPAPLERGVCVQFTMQPRETWFPRLLQFYDESLHFSGQLLLMIDAH